MKTQKGRRCIAQVILNHDVDGVMGHLHASAALLWERAQAPIEQEAGWTPELFWAFWKREKSLIPAGIRTLDRPPRGIISTPTTLSLLNHTRVHRERI